MILSSIMITKPKISPDIADGVYVMTEDSISHKIIENSIN